MKKIVILTDRLKIRTLQIKDITSEYINGLNDTEVNRFLVNVRLEKQTEKTVKDFTEKNLISDDSVLLGIFVKDGNKLIGTIRISNISYFHYLCSIGICIFNKNYWGKNYAFEALRKVAKFIFDELKLHYIEAGVYKENIASIKLFKKAGFKIMASFKDKYRYSDTFYPVVILSLINSKFNINLLKKDEYGNSKRGVK